MKIDINDPRITAFALGELTGGEATEIARAMRTDPRVRSAVDEVRETASMLHGTLGGGATQFLTTEQRATVRSAGEGPVIADIASARVSFWKRPAVVGIGAAAAVALGLFLSSRGGAPQSNPELADENSAWDWSQVDLANLTSPAVVDAAEGEPFPSADTVQEAAHAVAAAISDDTESYRKEVAKRISEQDLKSPLPMPELEEAAWKTITGSDSTFAVPAASGASSWPLLRRYVTEKKTLPPPRAIRIEELVNHLDYKAPTMLRGNGLIADIEICHTPWNPVTMLLAVHLGAATTQAPSAGAVVVFNPLKVKRARLLGYAGVKLENSGALSGPRNLSKSHGNYVIYELEPVSDGSASPNTAPVAEQTLATLQIGDQPDQSISLKSSQVKTWLNTSPDLRFASTLAATGMLLSTTTSTGDLDATLLKSLVSVIEKKDFDQLPSERKAAMALFKMVSGLLDRVQGDL